MLDSEQLLRPVLINGQGPVRLVARPEEEEKKEEQEKEKDAKQVEDDEVLGQEEATSSPTYLVQHKVRSTLLKNADKIFTFQQVNQSALSVPPETLVLKEHKNLDYTGLSQFPVTEQYFAVPLYMVFSEEMIDLEDPYLPKNNLDWLCERYSSQQAEIDDGATKLRIQELKHSHLALLRQEHSSARDDLLEKFMQAIRESLNDQDEAGADEFFWDDDISPHLTDTFIRVLQSTLSALRSPRSRFWSAN